LQVYFCLPAGLAPLTACAKATAVAPSFSEGAAGAIRYAEL